MSDFKYVRPTKLKSLSIVLPAYNEELNIVRTIRLAFKAASQVTDNFEIIVVNDGSTDRTGEIIQRLAARNAAQVRVLNNPKNLGYGPTVRHGLASARKAWVFFTDADGQFDLEELKFLVPFTDHYDFVVGRRKKGGIL